MKIITRSISEWDGYRYVTVEEDSYEYTGDKPNERPKDRAT